MKTPPYVTDSQFFDAVQTLQAAVFNKQVIIKRSTGEIEVVNNASFNVGFSNLGRGIGDTANIEFLSPVQAKTQRAQEINGLLNEKQFAIKELSSRVEDLLQELKSLK